MMWMKDDYTQIICWNIMAANILARQLNVLLLCCNHHMHYIITKQPHHSDYECLDPSSSQRCHHDKYLHIIVIISLYFAIVQDLWRQISIRSSLSFCFPPFQLRLKATTTESSAILLFQVKTSFNTTSHWKVYKFPLDRYHCCLHNHKQRRKAQRQNRERRTDRHQDRWTDSCIISSANFAPSLKLPLTVIYTGTTCTKLQIEICKFLRMFEASKGESETSL